MGLPKGFSACQCVCFHFPFSTLRRWLACFIALDPRDLYATELSEAVPAAPCEETIIDLFMCLASQILLSRGGRERGVTEWICRACYFITLIWGWSRVLAGRKVAMSFTLGSGTNTSSTCAHSCASISRKWVREGPLMESEPTASCMCLMEVCMLSFLPFLVV